MIQLAGTRGPAAVTEQLRCSTWSCQSVLRVLHFYWEDAIGAAQGYLTEDLAYHGKQRSYKVALREFCDGANEA